MDSTSGLALPAGFLLRSSASPAGEQSWTCRLVRRPGRRYTLHLSGSLHVAWAGRLAAGLAARNIAVVRGSARRGSTRWTGEIELAVLDGALEPSAIDFLALVREHADAAARERVALTACQVARTRRDVEVVLRAPDSVGFLGRILRLFADLALFPRAMRIETVAGEVRDVFLLQDAAGEPPREGTVTALRARLEALVRP
jgi:hypothetical protein